MGLELDFEAADLFGLTALSTEALSSRPNPRALGLTIPRTLDDIARPEGRHPLFDGPARRELAHKLEASLAPLEPHVAVLDSVRALAQPDATCVVAGQQPALFGGPLFNCYKALHIAKLARSLAERWNKPVVPILWNHADDHDIAEAHHAWFVNPHVDLVKLHLSGASSGRMPLSAFTCDNQRHDLAALAARLADLFADAPHAQGLAEKLTPQHGETLARAWTRLHLEWFGHLGVVVLEPDWIRNELSESLASLVTPSPVDALVAGSQRLKSVGLDVAIKPTTAALVFHLEDGLRRALRPGGDGWRYDDEPGSRTAAELAAEVVCDKAAYNAGALLRPLVQDMALPVSAYVGGWGELAYHAQLAELRRERGLDPGVFVPRASCTLTDARCRRALRQQDLGVGAYLRTASRTGPPTAPTPAAATDGSESAQRLRTLARDLHASLHAERPALERIDASLDPQLRRTANQARKLIERLAERVERVASNRSGTARRGQRRLASFLFPRGGPQERTLTTAEMLARFGNTWIDELFEALDPLPTEHLIARLDTQP